jgi:dynein heavy chain
VQDCLAFGKPLLIENIEEELDPILDPVLERRYVKKGKSFTIALADKEVCDPSPVPSARQEVYDVYCDFKVV